MRHRLLPLDRRARVFRLLHRRFRGIRFQCESTSLHRSKSPRSNLASFFSIRDSGANTTSGYFLNGTGYDNVAVLAVSAFSPQGDIGSIEYLSNFQSTVGSFLAQSKAAGKTRLVIDLQANGGGFVVAGYELFAQVRKT